MRNYFRYLSDNLSVVVDPTQTGNIPYRVEMKPVSKSDSFYTTIYRGSVYCNGEPVRIYLNDIIETNMDDYGWFRNITLNDGETSSFQRGTYVDVRIVLELWSGEDKYYLSDILNGYLTPDMEREKRFDVDDSVYVKPFIDLGYKVVPHIPYDTKSWSDEGMNVGFNLPVKMFINNDVDNVRIHINDPEGNAIVDVGKDSITYSLIGFNISDSFLKMGPPIEGEGYTVSAVYDDEDKPLAVIDYDPAEYYLMWVNRHGAVQCQPFCRKNTLNESVSSSYITTLTNESVNSRKSVEFTWTLNSHWLTYDEHGEFESLLVSKYVWLYDVKKGWFYPVNVTDSKWSYKNPNNNKRPFNLTVNVKSSQTQNIVY